MKYLDVQKMTPSEYTETEGVDKYLCCNGLLLKIVVAAN